MEKWSSNLSYPPAFVHQVLYIERLQDIYSANVEVETRNDDIRVKTDLRRCTHDAEK